MCFCPFVLINLCCNPRLAITSSGQCAVVSRSLRSMYVCMYAYTVRTWGVARRRVKLRSRKNPDASYLCLLCFLIFWLFIYMFVTSNKWRWLHLHRACTCSNIIHNSCARSCISNLWFTAQVFKILVSRILVFDLSSHLRERTTSSVSISIRWRSAWALYFHSGQNGI